MVTKKKRNWIKWLFDIDSNIIKSLNLIGLAITTYGVMYVLPQNNLKQTLGIVALGFLVLGLFQLIIFIINLCERKNE